MTTLYYEGAIQGDTPVTGRYVAVTVDPDTKKTTVASDGAGNGILTSAVGNTAGDACTVVMWGPCKGLLYTTAVGPGKPLASRGTDGALVPATSGETVVCTSRSGGPASTEIDVVVGCHFPAYLAAP